MFDVFKVTLVLMGKPEEKPQIICASEPDLTTKQWKALGECIIEMAEDGMNAVNISEIIIE